MTHTMFCDDGSASRARGGAGEPGCGRCAVLARLVVGIVLLAARAEAASPTTPERPLPQLAAEPELAARIAEYQAGRARARADLVRVRAEREADLAAALPSLDALAGGGADRVGLRVAELARGLAQIELWQAIIAAGEASPAAHGTAFTERDNIAWYAALLMATGDGKSADEMIRYAKLPAETSRLVADALVADATAQGTLLDGLAARLRESPKDVAVATAVDVILRRGVGEPMARGRLEVVAREMAPQSVNPLKSSIAAAMKADRGAAIASLVGQSGFRIVGECVDGSEFDADALSGKVVVVVFWTPRSAACLAELPGLIAAYDRHHREGLELVMVHSERGLRHVADFLARHPEASWPHLVDKEAVEKGLPHPLATAAGVSTYPSIFLIDRQGVLRSTDALENLEPAVRALLKDD